MARELGSGLELLGVRKDGSELPIEIGLSPFHEPEGTMAVAAISVISARKAAEKAIREREERFRTHVANLPETIYRCLHDEQWTMKFISDDVLELTGYGAEEFIDNRSRTFESVIHEEDRGLVLKEVEKAVAAKSPWIIEYRVVRADGSTRWVGERGRAIFRDGEEIEYLDGVIADITERKQLEDELRAARVRAAAADRSKSEFLSHMSHELRTPLNGVLGYAQILKRDRDATEKQRESLDAIVSCGDHLLSLINDVLDLSKIEAGQVDLDLGPCDLHRLIESVGAVVRQRAEGQGLSFDVEISSEVPQGIVTDAAKVRQILVNLLGDAVKFTKEGGVVLRVAEMPRGRLNFEIVDTGVGMDEAEMEDIFDPFKQVEAGKAAGGTGLGLAITSRLAERLGGGVSVRSEKGRGSVFAVDLPLEETNAGVFDALEAEGGLEFGELVLVPGQEVTVLVADDRETNHDILDKMLVAAGFRVRLVDDGDTALADVREERPDIVLMDVRMPRMNGIEAVQAIRADAELRDLKVIAVTASVFPEFREKAIAEGFDDFLGKPFRTEELMEKLKQHLGVEFAGPAKIEVVEEAEGAIEDLGDVPEVLIERLEAALKIKNLTAINTLAREMKDVEGAGALGEAIAKRSRSFDFAGLEKLIKELKS